MKISASIYSQKQLALSDLVRNLDAHRIDYFHVDCNDDVQVFEDIKSIRSISKTPIDLHIIAEQPEKYWDLLRSNPVELVTFQHENLKTDLKIPSDIKCKIGIAITSNTEIDIFEKYAQFADFILMMATVPGQSGGTFDKQNFRKIRQFKNRYPSKRIHVDGGVNGEVSFILRNMGVYSSVSGSYLFKAENIGFALLNLKSFENESLFHVKDFMMGTDEIPLIQENNLSFFGTLESIENYKLGFTLVTGENDAFSGIISNADIRKGLLKHRTFDDSKVKEMINRHPVVVNENQTVVDLLRIIKSKEFPVSYLPVLTDDGKISGAVTFINLVKGEA
jgi:pentose-5-phosphate-3-epimerase/CBS domain-containing protein